MGSSLTLSDNIDRLNNLARSIRSSATSTSPQPSSTGNLFTNAVLHTPLGDLIRDADPSELGLFTIVSPSSVTTTAVTTTTTSTNGGGTGEADGGGGQTQTVVMQPELTRIDVVSATPLRKQPASRRDDIKKPKEFEPEVYAEAALKYLNRYSSIRPMPRAQSQVSAILDQIQSIRQNMSSLNEALIQAQNADPTGSSSRGREQDPKAMAAEEEERIRDAHARIEELRARKEALTRKRGRLPFTKTIPSSSRPKPTTPTHSKPSDSKEEAFWNTPGAPGRILQFKNENGGNENEMLLLTDERMDVELGDVTGSFATPVPRARSRTKMGVGASGLGGEVLGEKDGDGEEGNETVSPDEVGNGRGRGEEQEDENEEEGEKTVMFSKPPTQDSEPISSSPTPSHVSEISFDPDAHASPPSPQPQAGQQLTESVSTPTKLGSGRLKIKITSDVEKIVAKIWASVGDIIMPGHPYDVTGKGIHKPPRAKETISHLQSLSTQLPAPPSPTSSSLSSLTGPSTIPTSSPSSGPTIPQILTAHMLLVLLSSPSPSTPSITSTSTPSTHAHSMPFTKLKELLGAKADSLIAVAGTGAMAGIGLGAGGMSTGGVGIAGQVVQRWGVAKRLLKVERGGGQQVVRFNV